MALRTARTHQQGQHVMGEARKNMGGSVGAQGTLGGMSASIGAGVGARPVMLGDAAYLWALVLIEVLTLAWLRQAFRRYHGG